LTYFKPTDPVFSGFRAGSLKWSGTCAAVANTDARIIGTNVSHMPIIFCYCLSRFFFYPWLVFGIICRDNFASISYFLFSFGDELVCVEHYYFLHNIFRREINYDHSFPASTDLSLQEI
jgi:hypothetical protein